jgi:hypothetical protein
MSFGSLPSVLGNGGGVAISVIGGTGLFANGTAAAPSISFASDTDTGIYRRGANELGFATGSLLNFWMTRGGGVSYLIGSVFNNSLNMFDTGAISLVAAGTNQNITLTPSGTGSVVAPKVTLLAVANGPTLTGVAGGILDFVASDGVTTNARFRLDSQRFLFGTTTDSGALLQIGTNTTTSAGGMVFGTDTFAYRTAAGRISFDSTSDLYLNIAKNGTIYGHWVSDASNVYFGSSTAIPLILRTNNTTALTLDSSQNATFAGTVKPQLATTAGAPAYVKGALYFDTTLNKLRVGGATAWETITSV